ncbi:uncharacterized protein LTR77_008792 [Saxophila tyrrhenica]|uniref:Uncharacterized protein n=1 Tax=Saxophila tyrrhenica TaxID=1690608 RepID=A0AAV9P4C1_9PEZI|nr:hypothetical protein LTR77_008792 [Saxophila tyrrhenica]
MFPFAWAYFSWVFSFASPLVPVLLPPPGPPLPPPGPPPPPPPAWEPILIDATSDGLGLGAAERAIVRRDDAAVGSGVKGKWSLGLNVRFAADMEAMEEEVLSTMDWKEFCAEFARMRI